MAGSPQFKVYRGKEYVASCKYAEDAAILVAALGEGSTIRNGHSTIVWEEGKETQPAYESYDFVAYTVFERINGGN